MDGLEVSKERMLANLNMTGGLVFSQRILLALIDKGVGRQEAYKMVQRNAKKVWGKTFLGVATDEHGLLPLAVELSNDPEVAQYLSADELKELTNTDYYTKYIDTSFQRVGL
jgi:adenylosuccinate lyase